MKDFLNLRRVIDEGIECKVFSMCAVSIGDKEGEFYRWCADDGNVAINNHTLFDMASVTKIISTTMITLVLIENNKLRLDDSVGDFFDCPEDKKHIKIKQLLTHTSGLSSSYDLQKYAIVPENIICSILEKPLVLPSGIDVIYSCPGFILLGRILESIENKTLDVLCEEYVLSPLHMAETCFNPKSINISCSSTDSHLTGIVNDNNARFMGGIAGNAGLFSNINDMSKFAGMLANKGETIISEHLFEDAIKCYTTGMCESRGLGFNLVDKRYKQTGQLFSVNSYGHTGYTGTSMFVDRETGLYVVILTNRTCFDLDYSIFQGYRLKMHNAIKEDLTELN